MKIGLIGTFDVSNYGDCLFPEVYMHELASRISNCAFRLHSLTENSSRILSEDKLVCLPEKLDAKQSFSEDILILIGGETISIGHGMGTYIMPEKTLSAALRLWLPACLAASSSELKFYAHCVGVASLSSDIEPSMFRLLKMCDGISFRDAYSYERVHQYIPDSRCFVDPVFRVSRLLPEEEWKAYSNQLPAKVQSRGYLVAQISAPYLKGNISEWTSKIAEMSNELDIPVVLLPICHFLHDEILLSVALQHLNRAGVEAFLLKGERSVLETAAIIGASAGFCGSSLHGAVTAISFGKPVSILGHDHKGKHNGVMESVGLNNVVTTDIANLPAMLDNCRDYDLDEIQRNAVDKAGEGISWLVTNLLEPKCNKEIQPSASDIHAIQRADRAIFSKTTNRLKRTFFRATKNAPRTAKAYFRIRQKLLGNI